MQTAPKKADGKRKEKKDETSKSHDEKLKKSVYTVSTPKGRENVPKTTTNDIYSQKKTVSKAPKKVPGISSKTSISPMKGLLNSSASSVSQISNKTSTPKPSKKLYSAKGETNPIHSARNHETPRKKEIFTNVTVNSPVVKRKLDLNPERLTKEVSKRISNSTEIAKRTKEAGRGEPTKDVKVTDKPLVKIKETGERQRTKTRTLDDSEVKILTPRPDNNAELLHLTQKFTAKPKAFYVDLDEGKSKNVKEPSDEEEVSYEDDFESYESDFDSYHSESEASVAGSDANSVAGSDANSVAGSDANSVAESERSDKHYLSLKENDERELDSGNFDLRDARSAKSKPAMDYIQEVSEAHLDHNRSIDENGRSLDEGFQDMSSSSTSMRTVEVADRPVFLDFNKSKRSKLKRKISERLLQRAKDLFNFITLHEMTFSLFEMKPITYDLYMATFGRSNYTQSGVQTFDDGITEEVQTDEVTVAQKWTQYPVKFTKQDITQNKDVARKYSINSEDYFVNFTFLNTKNMDDLVEKQISSDENYKENPLRILFEQKDGVGSDKMLPYETYKTKLKSRDYSTPRLSKFLKRVESKISNILSKNTGSKDVTDLEKSEKLPFSKGYLTISPKAIQDPKLSFLRNSNITGLYYSENKSNLLITAHKNAKGVNSKKNILCLWDVSVASDPLKVLLSIDNVVIGKFRGSADGLFIAALEDGSIHLWDLSEEPTWRDDVAMPKKTTDLVEVESQQLTQTEKDREWNMRNGQVGLLQPQIPIALQSCAFTNSGVNMNTADTSDRVVGLQFLATQVVSLQRIGIITIWSIIQEKKQNKDIGRAFWSKIKLEKNQTINLSEHIDVTLQVNTNFNLNSAKRRISLRKSEKPTRKDTSRPKTASKFEFDSDRPYSAASMRKKVLSVEINVPKSWENGIVCSDLRIVNFDNVNVFLVAKNNGEVLCCRRCLGVLRVERFSVANDSSQITSLDVSSKNIPYFLAATDSGTVNLCSLLEKRVLLTLDCRNTLATTENYQSDHKGRFVSSSSTSQRDINERMFEKMSVASVVWCGVNHCCIVAMLRDRALIVFDLTHSDITTRAIVPTAAVVTAQSLNSLALLTPNGEVHVHRMVKEEMSKEYLHLFTKYVALL